MRRQTSNILGRTVSGNHPLRIDVPKLVTTRLLIQAASGGGKSWLIRLALEQTHGQVQHIVLDPEGEFASLRERYDYVLVGGGGDIAADPDHAGLLARRLLELRVSAVCDLFELKAPQRRQFVRTFIEAMINAPKALWHPCLVVIDEAHDYCPERREAESMEAVIDLCTRGRKRGFCAVLATQRLANLSKPAAAQCLNVFVGRTVLDIDRRRATEVLGVSGPEQRAMNAELMRLDPGQFYSVGTALEPGELTLTKIGRVRTHHPEIASGRGTAPGPPPPPERVKAVLAKLGDLPREAEEEADEKRRLMIQVRELRRELGAAKQAAGDLIPAIELRKAERSYLEDRKRCEEQVAAATSRFQAFAREVAQAAAQLGEAAGKAGEAAEKAEEAAEIPRVPAPERPAAPRPARGRRDGRDSSPTDHPVPDADEAAEFAKQRKGARVMVEVLARHHPTRMTRSQLATLSGYAPRGGTYGGYLGNLRRAGFIKLDGKEVSITEAGLAACGEIAPEPMTPAEVLTRWRGALRLGERKMLDALLEIMPDGLTRAELAEQTGYEVTGGTFGGYLGTLRRNGLVEERDGLLRPSEAVFGEMRGW